MLIVFETDNSVLYPKIALFNGLSGITLQKEYVNGSDMKIESLVKCQNMKICCNAVFSTKNF